MIVSAILYHASNSSKKIEVQNSVSQMDVGFAVWVAVAFLFFDTG